MLRTSYGVKGSTVWHRDRIEWAAGCVGASLWLIFMTTNARAEAPPAHDVAYEVVRTRTVSDDLLVGGQRFRMFVVKGGRNGGLVTITPNRCLPGYPPFLRSYPDIDSHHVLWVVSRKTVHDEMVFSEAVGKLLERMQDCGDRFVAKASLRVSGLAHPRIVGGNEGEGSAAALCRPTRGARRSAADIVAEMDEQELFLAAALSDGDVATRLIAVMHLDDQPRLERVALEADDWNVRRDAVERLESASLLEAIARRDCDEFVRSAAVEKVTAQSVLLKAATADSSLFVNRMAVKSLTSQDVLVTLALTARKAEVRGFAAMRVESQSVLGRIATTDRAASVRRVAVGMLKSDVALARIASTDVDETVRSTAERLRVFRKSSGQEGDGGLR